MELAVNVVAWLGALVFALYGYDLMVSLAGFLPLRHPPIPASRARFAVLVCAHNEQWVIGGIVRSALEQDYDSDRVKVFVVADNCTDGTAEAARGAGAVVLERFDLERRTKGYALQWGIGRLREIGEFDALCVVDADNVLDRHFLSTMNAYLAAGHVAIQAYLDTKNPDETWVTRCIAASYFVTNRFWMRARFSLGLPATLGGTGFCLSWGLVGRYPWDPGSLADDLELTMRLIRDGVQVSYCYHARTYDEKPRTLRLSLRQRGRWMQGHHDVAFRWLAPIFMQMVRTRSMMCFDALLHLLQPMRMLISFWCLAMLIAAKIALPNHPAIERTFWFSAPAIALAAAVFVFYPLVVAAAERKLLSTLRTLVPFMLFSFTWIPAATIGLLKHRRRVWLHTAHGPAASLPQATDAAQAAASEPQSLDGGKERSPGGDA